MNRRIASIDLRRGTVKIAAMRGLGFAVFGLAGCAPGVPTGPCGAAETAALTIEGQSVSCEAVTRAFFERGYDAFETAFVEATLVERRAAALGIVVTETLYRRYPDWSEGQLAKMRAAVVNADCPWL
jgi:hypothetical protein